MSAMWYLLTLLYEVFVFLSYSSLMHVSCNVYFLLIELINLNSRLTFAKFTGATKVSL